MDSYPPLQPTEPYLDGSFLRGNYELGEAILMACQSSCDCALGFIANHWTSPMSSPPDAYFTI